MSHWAPGMARNSRFQTVWQRDIGVPILGRTIEKYVSWNHHLISRDGKHTCIHTCTCMYK